MLNIHVIFDELSSFNALINAADNLPLTLLGVRLIRPEHVVLSNQYIYIVDDDALTFLPEKDACINIIYIGSRWDVLNLKDNRWQVIYLPNKPNELLVFEVVLNIFEKYAEWNHEMLHLIATGADPHSVLESGCRYILNPLAVLDNSLSLIMMSEPSLHNIKNTIWEELVNQGFLNADGFSPDELNFVNNKLPKSDTSFLYHLKTRDIKYTCMSVGLFCNNHQIGVICSTSINAQFTNGQLALITTIKHHLQIAFSRSEQYSALIEGSYHYIDHIIRGTVVDDLSLDYYLAKRSWKIQDNYSVCFLRQRENKYLSIAIKEQYSSRVRRLLSDAYVAAYENGILIITHNSCIFKRKDRELNDLSNFSEKLELVCGVSMDFYNFKLIGQAFMQSTLAIKDEFLQNEQYIYYFHLRYQEHILFLLKSSCDIKCLCHPKMIYLFEKDKNKNSDLIATLYAYLLNGRNVSSTAKKLYLHRNTLLYRIDQIGKKLEMNINDISDNEAFMLLMSCIILQSL